MDLADQPSKRWLFANLEGAVCPNCKALVVKGRGKAEDSIFHCHYCQVLFGTITYVDGARCTMVFTEEGLRCLEAALNESKPEDEEL